MDCGFQNSLFGCCNNCKVLLCTWCCPCYVAGKVAERVGDNCCLCGAVMFVPIANIICRATIRGKVREQKGIPGSFVKDCLTAWFCAACALCQEAQEVNALDMAQSMARE